ncbi:MAG: hypothetical protein JWN04_4542 [Myxococcaceae bacterium]|nr:hypothetical protein [Myxococcaceae bacterium]
MATFELTSSLAAPAEQVWRHASTFAGINRELWPVHMSGGSRLTISRETTTGVVLFRSVLTLLRVVPLDVHSFGLLNVWPGVGFEESSRSLLQKSWHHTRTIEPLRDQSCLVRDQLEFEPRILSTWVSLVVRRVFERRHARLRALFGVTHLLPSASLQNERQAESLP